MIKNNHYVSGQECVIAKIKNAVKLVSIDDLFCLNKIDPLESIYVLDRDSIWTKVTAIEKHELEEASLVYIKIEGTDSIITTSNYPLIISNDPEDTIEARYTTSSRRLLRDGQIETRDFSGTVDHIKVDFMDHYIEDGYCFNRYKGFYHTCRRNIDLEGKKISLLGYYVGKFISTGNYVYDKWGELTGVQVPCSVEYSEELARGIYRDTGIALEVIHVSEVEDLLYTENIAMLRLLLGVFNLPDESVLRKLPPDILSYPKEFQLGVIDAILGTDPRHPYDLEPTYKRHGRKLSAQFAVVSRTLDIEGRMAFKEGNHPAEYPRCGYILNWNRRPFSKSVKSEWRQIVKIMTLSNRTFLNQNKYVFRVNTESHSLLINNIWMHD